MNHIGTLSVQRQGQPSGDLRLLRQEQYYKWWYDWAKDFVVRDPDLNYAKGVEFAHYPYGASTPTRTSTCTTTGG